MTTKSQPNGTLSVTNWDRWQTYRKDRGSPPWIKIHRNLLTNVEWSNLSDAEKGQLVSIWIVAADKKGIIPSDPKILRKFCQLDDAPNIRKFKELGFLSTNRQPHDDQVTPECQPDDAPEESRGEKKRVEESRAKKASPIPTDFSVTKTMEEWGDSKKLNGVIENQTERFINHALSNNRKQVDWVASWRNWMLKSVEFSGGAQKQTGTGEFNSTGKRLII